LVIFLSYYVVSHGGSSKSVANILSAIRVFCHYSHQPWLSEDQLYRLSKIRKEIRLEDSKPVNRKLPIKRELIRRGLDHHWKVTESMSDMLSATITLFRHNGLLRGDEIFSHIRVQDVTWDHGSGIRSFRVHIGRPDQPGKTAQDGGGFLVQIVDHKGPSAYKYLRTWFDLHGLWIKPLLYIFPNWLHQAKARYGFSSINVSVRNGTRVGLMLCLPHSVKIQSRTQYILFVPEVQRTSFYLVHQWQRSKLMVAGNQAMLLYTLGIPPASIRGSQSLRVRCVPLYRWVLEMGVASPSDVLDPFEQ
jgi:hypothetical protein